MRTEKRQKMKYGVVMGNRMKKRGDRRMAEERNQVLETVYMMCPAKLLSSNITMCSQ